MPLSNTLKSIIPITAYLLVGYISLFTAFLSIRILRIPNWLIGRNAEAIKQSIEMKRDEVATLEELQANITKADSSENTDDVNPESNS